MSWYLVGESLKGWVYIKVGADLQSVILYLYNVFLKELY